MKKKKGVVVANGLLGIEKYDKPNKPVIITDIVSKWEAKKNWTKEKLLEKYGSCEFKTDEVDYLAKVSVWQTQ